VAFHAAPGWLPLPCCLGEYGYTFTAAIGGPYLADAVSMAARAGWIVMCARRGRYCRKEKAPAEAGASR